MMKKYNLILNQQTFLWVKNNEGLIYNSENFRRFVFTQSDKLTKICQHLLNIDNLYTVDLSEEELKNEDISFFTDHIVSINAGRLIKDGAGTEKDAVSLMPVLKVLKNDSHYIQEHQNGIARDIINNIHELTFYVNGSKFGDDKYYKQTIFPISTESKLDSEKIVRFIKNSRNSYLFKINLVGNIFSYPEYFELLNNIILFEVPVTICILASDFIDNKEQLKKNAWHDKISFNIIVDKKSDINLLINILDDINISFSTTFLVFSEQDCLEIDNISSSLNSSAIPIYNGNNINFFESFIFLNQEDILSTELTKRQIFMRQATNTNNFGKLTILSDGSVYANVNEEPLGIIDDTPYSIVYQEFTKGKSWLGIRNQSPCKDCIYQWLCPSPSDYETAIGRTNLCHVKL